jgi:outer membrane protein
MGSSLASAQSLIEVYQAARDYDAAYLGSLAQARSADFKTRQAESKRLPTVGLSAGVNRSGTSLPVDGPVAIAAGATADGNQFNTSTQVALQAKQALYNPGNTAQINQAQRSLDAAQADLEIAEQDLMVRVAQAYFDVLASRDQLAAAQANAAAISEQLASAKRNFEVGNATITDAREAQARFDLASAQEIAATNDLMTKRAALDQLVGRTAVVPKPLMSPIVLPPLTPSGMEDWLSRADTAPTVRKAQVGLDIAKEEIQLAKAGHLPTVDLVGTLARTHNNSRTSTTLPGNTDNASIGVQGNLPLFAGFAVQNRVKETLALEEKSERDLDAARRGVTLGTRQAYLGVQSGFASVKAYEAAETSTKLALEATELGYRVGVRVNIDVLNAQTQLYTTQRDLSKARYDVIMATLKLRQAVGALKVEDLEAVNRLLTK